MIKRHFGSRLSVITKEQKKNFLVKRGKHENVDYKIEHQNAGFLLQKCWCLKTTWCFN